MSAGVVGAGVVSAGVVTEGVVGAGVVGAGVVSAGVVSARLVGAGMVSAGLVGAGVVSAGVVAAGMGKGGGFQSTHLGRALRERVAGAAFSISCTNMAGNAVVEKQKLATKTERKGEGGGGHVPYSAAL